eukprot:GFUD01019934.1.p1 GENE.GFUD01019934.1~~GFUD01019934.1.p1  ORF type:complete len:724 (-),score=194.61 GFUD01019934.1:76-2247(-)
MNYAATLDTLIRDSYDVNVKELVDLWVTMGLSKQDVDERMDTVRLRVSDLTAEMVECDRKNKAMIEEICNDLQTDIRILWRKLKMSGEPELLPSGLPLLEQQSKLTRSLASLEEKREEIMEQFRSAIDEESVLADELGMETVFIDEDTIPEEEDMQRVKENLRKMIRVKEERETRMFTMKEQIVTLLECLGMDLNTTILGLDSLKLSDLLSVQHTKDELRMTFDHKKVEVTILMKQISALYARLDTPASEQCPLSTGQVCGVEELVKNDNFLQLKEEKLRLDIIKKENMAKFINNAKIELDGLWKACLVSEDEKSHFLAGLEEDTDSEEEMLAAVESEINRLGEYFSQHKETIQKLVAYLDLRDVAEDLKERMMDPNRLFKSRGPAMVKEEQDRKKVNSWPRRKEELLALAKNKGNLIVYGEPLSSIVEARAKIYEELFPTPTTRSAKVQSGPLSSTRSVQSCNPASSLGTNKTATPGSTKKVGRDQTTPAGRKAGRTLLRHTPLLVQPSSQVRTQGMQGGVCPLARPNKRMIGSNTNTTPSTTGATAKFSGRMQISDLVPQNDRTVNESIFSDNVPFHSTFSKDMENNAVLSGVFDKKVVAQDVIVENSTVAKMRSTPGSSKLLRQTTASSQSAKATSKLRRSNSCSEITLASRKQGVQCQRLGSKQDGQKNLPIIRECEGAGSRPPLVRSKSCMTASSTKRGVEEIVMVSRAGCSRKLVLR